MIEIIKHIFGFCGEPHINIFTILMSTPIVSYIIYRATKDQLKWQKELNDRGYRAEVCNGLDEAIDVIDNYLNNKVK